ncbi:hypothetical protein ACQEVS_32390 [Streptomyces sp. CA-181903]|uniref:hypothetical protein n=1 Tax=Streptomyces sp. CA-181903 TaxID=3240055 RepID=UPI003D8CDD2E
MHESVLAPREPPEAEGRVREPWMCCDTAGTSRDVTDPPRCPLSRVPVGRGERR